jgi:hypothetical protein
VGHLEHSKCQWSHPGKIIYFVFCIIYIINFFNTIIFIT